MTWTSGTPAQHNTYRRERTRRLLSFGLPIVMAAALLTAISVSPAQADPCGTGGNAITCENSKPGTPQSVWDITGSGDSSIQGFATDMSVNVGSQINFKIDTNASNYSIDIYRTGWYQGLGARKIASIAPSAALPQTQPQCISDATTELYDCGNWAVSASWNVPSTAVSGVYIALLTRADTGGKSQITFVVRDVSSHSDVLFQTSDTTWQAYNTYGGADFYQGGANGRAYKISYNRPFVTRDGITERDFYFDNQYPLVRFLEKNGYDVSYFSEVDTDRFGSDLLNHHVFLSVGHDEYWSAQQRNNVTAARDAGVNLQFLSGNEMYWHTRWEPSVDPSATPYRTLVCYKETWSNAKIDPSSEWTGTWRDPRFAPQSAGAGLPENAVSGTIFRVNQGDLPITVSALEGKLRIWRNTPLASMAAGTSTALAAHTVGYESDEDMDNGFRPAGLIHLSTTTGAVDQVLTDFGSTVAAGTTTHHLTMYRAASGALVFSAGSIQWTWGLDQNHDGNGAPADPNMQQAQVNLLADMGAQPASLVAPLVASSASTDQTAPVTTITAPASGATIANGSAVTVTGTASDSGGQVAGVEVSTDGGTTWHAATGTTNWSYTYYQQGSGTQSVRARAIDDSGNYSATPPVTNVSVIGPFSVLGQEPPATPDAGDASAVELGLQFTPNQNGFVTGVRFFKSTANTGTHTGSLWDASGNKLASVTFSGETASGWQTANFASPVAVTSGQTYVVSYSDPQGHYSAVSWYWSYRGRNAGPLTVAGGFGSQPAGVYNSTIGAFPTSSYQQGNYYVDAVFNPASTSPLAATNPSPAAGASSVPTNTTVSAQFSKDVTASSIQFTVAPTGGAAVAGTVAYDTTSRVATFTPTSALAAGVQYNVTLAATDTTGGTLASGQSWSFTTAQSSTPGVCPCSLFPDSTVPTVLDAADNAAVTLGVHFTANTSGTVTGIRFYKSTANTGTHTGSLWSSTGTLLASGTFTNESTSGWQTLMFNTPVNITAGTDYVAAYRTTVGHYSVTLGAFDGKGYTYGPLSVSANGGAYSYADAFPGTLSTTNYYADLIFQPATAPSGVTVTSTSPANGATGVATNSTVTAQLSGAVSSGTPTLALASSSGAVAGTSSYNATSNVITFTPSAALAASTSYTATVTSNGTTPSGGTFTFTTAAASGTSQYSLLSGVIPNTPADSDPSAVEVGMSFSTAVAGSVTAIKFYKGTGNTGTHTGSLWSSTGQRLASVTFSNETATGWQTAQLSTPVALTVGQTYVVSYFAPNGHYASTENYFTTAQTSGPLTAGSSSNGLYIYTSSSAFPTQSWNASNYFVDVVFTTGGSAPAPVTVTSTSPANGATGVATNSTVTAQLSGAVSSGTPTLALASSSGAVAGTSSYNATSNVITFTPSAALAASTSYTATVTSNGTTPSGGTFTFTTAAAAPAPVTVTSTSPANGATGVSPTTTVTAQLSGASATNPSVSLTSAGGPVAGSTSYDSTSHVVTFTPTSALAWTMKYTATVSVGGTALSGGTWSFTTADQPTTVTAQTIFAANATPDYPSWDDPNSVQVGVRFSASVAGTVTGIRFYKGTQNTGTHDGYLWSSTGTLLATVTFTNETATGWQSANFSQPVSIQPGVEYRASYHSSAGWYAVSLGALTSPVTNGSLSTPASGGVYLYGTTYPNNVSNHNYWVDVYFLPAK